MSHAKWHCEQQAWLKRESRLQRLLRHACRAGEDRRREGDVMVIFCAVGGCGGDVNDARFCHNKGDDCVWRKITKTLQRQRWSENEGRKQGSEKRFARSFPCSEFPTITLGAFIWIHSSRATG